MCTVNRWKFNIIWSWQRICVLIQKVDLLRFLWYVVNCQKLPLRHVCGCLIFVLSVNSAYWSKKNMSWILLCHGWWCITWIRYRSCLYDLLICIRWFLLVGGDNHPFEHNQHKQTVVNYYTVQNSLNMKSYTMYVTSLWWRLWCHDTHCCHDTIITVPNKECGEIDMHK